MEWSRARPKENQNNGAGHDHLEAGDRSGGRNERCHGVAVSEGTLTAREGHSDCMSDLTPVTDQCIGISS